MAANQASARNCDLIKLHAAQLPIDDLAATHLCEPFNGLRGSTDSMMS